MNHRHHLSNLTCRKYVKTTGRTSNQTIKNALKCAMYAKGIGVSMSPCILLLVTVRPGMMKLVSKIEPGAKRFFS